MTIAITTVKSQSNLIQLIYCFFLMAVFISNAQANELETKIEVAFEKGQLKGLHSVYVMHKGSVVAESYFSGHDERYGDRLGIRKFDASSLHDLRSITKSIVSLLYGIALSEGLVPDPDRILVDQFPQYEDLVNDSNRRKILIHHTLAMMMGTQWDESLPFTSSQNSEIAMERAPDRYRYALDRPIVNEPGKEWLYNGGATTLIGQIIAQGTGKPIDEYAKEKLFAPLNITEYEWLAGSDGTPAAASGLRMNPSDLAKIGLTLNNNGLYEGTQIIPPSWIKRSFTANTYDANTVGYGYFWFLAPADDPVKWVEAQGNGGQFFDLVQSSELVIVIFSGNYNHTDDWEMPVKLMDDIIFPALFPG